MPGYAKAALKIGAAGSGDGFPINYAATLQDQNGLGVYNTIPPTCDMQAGPIHDPWAQYVVFQSSFQGDDLGTVFANQCQRGTQPVIGTGTPVTSKTHVKFGRSSGFFDGSSRIDVPSSPDYAFGASDFTIEWFQWTANSGSFQVMLDFRGGTSSGLFPTFYVNTGSMFYFTNGANKIQVTALRTSGWQWWALARTNGIVSMYCDRGVLFPSLEFGDPISTMAPNVGSIADTNVYVQNGLQIGAGTASGVLYTGYISNLRITNGVARYQGAYAKVPTAPFTPLGIA